MPSIRHSPPEETIRHSGVEGRLGFSSAIGGVMVYYILCTNKDLKVWQVLSCLGLHQNYLGGEPTDYKHKCHFGDIPGTKYYKSTSGEDVDFQIRSLEANGYEGYRPPQKPPEGDGDDEYIF